MQVDVGALMDRMAASAGGAFEGGADDAERFSAAWEDAVMDTARVRDAYAYAAENPYVLRFGLTWMQCRPLVACLTPNTGELFLCFCVSVGGDGGGGCARCLAACVRRFAGLADAFARGMELYRDGRLAEAVLAFEAVVRGAPDHSESWRMLGLCHAESDEDVRAIMCFERAVEHDPCARTRTNGGV